MKYLILYLGILLSLFTSCTERIDIDTTNSDPVLVIYGCITNELTYQKVEVSRSSPYFDDQPNQGISGAKVTISSSSGDEIWQMEESKSDKGQYLTIQPVAANASERYMLKVEYDFNNDGTTEVYEAVTTVQQPFEIDSAKINSLNIIGRHQYSFNIYGQDSSEKDFYVCKFLVNDSLVSSSISQYILFDDKIINGAYLNGLMITSFADVKEKADYGDDIPDYLFFVESGDKITIEISRVEKGYYDFIMQCQQGIDGENPFFGGPPSNIDTNITTGAVGYFSSFSPTKFTVTVP